MGRQHIYQELKQVDNILSNILSNICLYSNTPSLPKFCVQAQFENHLVSSHECCAVHLQVVGFLDMVSAVSTPSVVSHGSFLQVPEQPLGCFAQELGRFGPARESDLIFDGGFRFCVCRIFSCGAVWPLVSCVLPWCAGSSCSSWESCRACTKGTLIQPSGECRCGMPPSSQHQSHRERHAWNRARHHSASRGASGLEPKWLRKFVGMVV